MTDRLKMIVGISGLFALMVAAGCGLYAGLAAFVGGVVLPLAVIGLSAQD